MHDNNTGKVEGGEASGCPDENTLIEFAEGLDRHQMRSVQAHLDDCGLCRRSVAAVARTITAGPADRDPARLVPGTAVGRYVVERALGQGGMGVVYLARDPDLQRSVALKFLHPSADQGSDLKHAVRLKREAQSLARLAHPNVVSVFEVADHRGRTFVAMEYVPGRTLASWLRDRPSASDILEVLRQAGRGLAALHECGLIHRDFKPGNVIIGIEHGRVDRVRILDLGLSLYPRGDHNDTGSVADSDTLSTKSSFGGTPAYMAPEVARGEPPSVASDVYAFCVTAIEAQTGQRPQQQDMATAGLSATQHILLAGLSRDPKARPPTMRALLRALERAQRRHRWIWTAAGVMALAIPSAGALMVLASPSDAPPCVQVDAHLPNELHAWRPIRRAQAQQKFMGTPLPFAADAWVEVDAHLTRYVSRWSERRQELCHVATASLVDAPQIDARSQCLLHLSHRLSGAVDAMLEASPKRLSTKLSKIYAVPGPGICWDESRPPEPPAGLTTQLNALDTLWDEEWARDDAPPDYERLLRAVSGIERQAAAAPGPQGQALYRRGRLHYYIGRLAAAEEDLINAVRSAEQAGDDITRAKATTLLMSVVGVSQLKEDEGHRWRRAAEAAVAGLGRAADIGLRLELLNETGRLHSGVGERQAALRYHQQALSLARAELPPDHPRLASCLALAAVQSDPSESALAMIDQALGILAVARGAKHRDLVVPMNSRAIVLNALGRHQEALGTMNESNAIQRANFGELRDPSGFILMAEALQGLGRTVEAQEALESAYDLALKLYGPEAEVTRALKR